MTWTPQPESGPDTLPPGATDPAVHAALLAALVRAGVLEEERESATLRMFGGKVVMSKARARYVTRWEDVDA